MKPLRIHIHVTDFNAFILSYQKILSCRHINQNFIIMFSKSNLIATAVTGIFLFLGGYLIWGILTVDFFAQHAGSATGVNKEPDLLFVAIGCLIEAFFLSTIYGKWARGIHSAKEGFELGALVGAFVGFGEGLIWFGTTNLSDLTGFLASGFLNTIFVGLAGALVAVIYKSTTK